MVMSLILPIPLVLGCMGSFLKKGEDYGWYKELSPLEKAAHRLGLLSYWVVNTIRYRLKTKGETCFWTEIVRRMSTQKAVTTEGSNVLGENVQMRLCSEPTKVAEDIYDKLEYKKMPFRKIRLCCTQWCKLKLLTEERIYKTWNSGAWDKSPTVAGRVRNSWFPWRTKSRGWKWRYVVKS